MNDSHTLAKRFLRLQSDNALQVLEARMRLFPDSDGCFQTIADGYCVFQGTGIAFSEANGLGVNGLPQEDDLAAVEAFFRKVNLPTTIKVIPEVEPDLLVHLLHRGYQIQEQIHVLFKDSGDFPLATIPTDCCTIHRALPNEDRLWAETIYRGFKESATPADSDWRLLLPWFHHPKAVSYLARVDNQTVGAALMVLSNEIVNLVIACVVPEFRNRGIHKAMLHTRLAFAFQHGATMAIVTGSPGGHTQTNTERLGFRHELTQLRLQSISRPNDRQSR